jgi:hypothetical protein
VKARRRHQGGEAVEQLERGQELRATADGAPFRVVVDEALTVELAQPVQGGRWPGTVPQQPLAPGAVGGLDAHRGVDGEAAAMLPLPHRLRAIGWQQAAAHEHAVDDHAMEVQVGIEAGAEAVDESHRAEARLGA